MYVHKMLVVRSEFEWLICLQIPKNLKEASKLAHNKAPLLQLEIQNQTLGLESQSRCLL